MWQLNLCVETVNPCCGGRGGGRGGGKLCINSTCFLRLFQSILHESYATYNWVSYIMYLVENLDCVVSDVWCAAGKNLAYIDYGSFREVPCRLHRFARVKRLQLDDKPAPNRKKGDPGIKQARQGHTGHLVGTRSATLLLKHAYSSICVLGALPCNRTAGVLYRTRTPA